MRALYNPTKPMDRADYTNFWVGADPGRCASYLFLQWAKVSTLGYSRSDLRDDMRKELKALRKLTEKKETETLPPCMLAEVMKVPGTSEWFNVVWS